MWLRSHRCLFNSSEATVVVGGTDKQTAKQQRIYQLKKACCYEEESGLKVKTFLTWITFITVFLYPTNHNPRLCFHWLVALHSHRPLCSHSVINCVVREIGLLDGFTVDAFNLCVSLELSRVCDVVFSIYRQNISVTSAKLCPVSYLVIWSRNNCPEIMIHPRTFLLHMSSTLHPLSQVELFSLWAAVAPHVYRNCWRESPGTVQISGGFLEPVRPLRWRHVLCLCFHKQHQPQMQRV